MAKHLKPNSKSDRPSTAKVAEDIMGLKNDLATFEGGRAVRPIDDGSRSPHTTQPWLPSNEGRRGVKTEASTRANLDAAREMGFDPDQAEAVHNNLNSGRAAFDDRNIQARGLGGGGDDEYSPCEGCGEDTHIDELYDNADIYKDYLCNECTPVECEGCGVSMPKSDGVSTCDDCWYGNEIGAQADNIAAAGAQATTLTPWPGFYLPPHEQYIPGMNTPPSAPQDRGDNPNRRPNL